QDVAWVAADALCAGLDVPVKFLGSVQPLVRGEDDFGRRGSKPAAIFRLAGLDDDRVTLRGARHIERALDLEMLAAMLRGMQLVQIEKSAALLVANEGVILEALPELLDHVDMLCGARVAEGMRMLPVEIEIVGCGIRTGRDDIPAGSAAGNEVERRELAGK